MQGTRALLGLFHTWLYQGSFDCKRDRLTARGWLFSPINSTPCLYLERQFKIKIFSLFTWQFHDCPIWLLGDLSRGWHEAAELLSQPCSSPRALCSWNAGGACLTLRSLISVQHGKGKFAEWNAPVKESKALCTACCKTNHEESEAEKLLSCYFCIRDFNTLLKKSQWWKASTSSERHFCYRVYMLLGLIVICILRK